MNRLSTSAYRIGYALFCIGIIVSLFVLLLTIPTGGFSLVFMVWVLPISTLGGVIAGVGLSVRNVHLDMLEGKSLDEDFMSAAINDLSRVRRLELIGFFLLPILFILFRIDAFGTMLLFFVMPLPIAIVAGVLLFKAAMLKREVKLAINQV